MNEANIDNTSILWIGTEDEFNEIQMKADKIYFIKEGNQDDE